MLLQQDSIESTRPIPTDHQIEKLDDELVLREEINRLMRQAEQLDRKLSSYDRVLKELKLPQTREIKAKILLSQRDQVISRLQKTRSRQRRLEERLRRLE